MDATSTKIPQLSELAVEKVRSELHRFSKEAKGWFEHPSRSFVRQYFEFFREFFTKENLARAEWPDFQKVGDHIHAMNQVALAKKRAFGSRTTA